MEHMYFCIREKVERKLSSNKSSSDTLSILYEYNVSSALLAAV